MFDGGDEVIARKFGEESLELILAYMEGQKESIICESADVIYHLFVLLASCGVDLRDIKDELEKRRE